MLLERSDSRAVINFNNVRVNTFTKKGRGVDCMWNDVQTIYFHFKSPSCGSFNALEFSICFSMLSKLVGFSQ